MTYNNINGMTVWTNETKEQFIEKAEKMAKNYEALKRFYTVAVRPLYDKFAGKPFNNRLVVALQQAALEVDENIIIDHSGQHDDGSCFIYVGTTYADNSFTGSLTLHFVCTDHQGEKIINSAASLRENNSWDGKRTEDTLQEQAYRCRQCIEHYDEYMAKVCELIKATSAYNDLPWVLHSHIKNDYLRTC